MGASVAVQPEDVGVNRAAVRGWISELDSLGVVHSAMVLRHGKIVSETYWQPYNADTEQTLNSLSKTVTALGVGFAVSEGLLKVTDKVSDLLDLPDSVKLNPGVTELTVQHLLTMTGGHRDLDIFSTRFGPDIGRAFVTQDWVDVILSAPFLRQPGLQHSYNTASTYLLSVIITKLTGKRLFDFLTPRLFRPLGITGAVWEQSAQRYNAGGFGLNLKLRDIAKIGQLILDEGVWNGKRLLPASWIRKMRSKQTETGSEPGNESDWGQGYGYQIWLCRHGAIRGDGAHGQFMVIWPQYDAVIAITAATNDMAALLETVWRELDPAFSDENGRAHQEVAPDSASGAAALPAQLLVPVPSGTSSQLGLDGIYNTDQGDLVALGTLTDHIIRVRLPLVTNGAFDLSPPAEFQAGNGYWLRNDPISDPVTKPRRGAPRGDLRALDKKAEFAASYAWTDNSTLEVRGIALPSQFEWTWRITFPAVSAPHENRIVDLKVTQNVTL